MAREKICGIYCIENLINNKKYVGQSVDIYKRWCDHKWSLNNGQHNNTHLLKAWHKYGEDNFSFYVLELCESSQLNNREVYWVEKLDSHSNGYNQTDGGDGCLGKEWTEEEIEKISQSIFQIDMCGHIVRKWPSIQYASRQLNISARQIWNCVNKHITYVTKSNGKRYSKVIKTAGGFIWVYEKNIDTFNLQDHIDTRNKPIRQYDLNWRFIALWPSAESTKRFGYSHNVVMDVCKGKFMQANGFIWTFDDIEDLDKYIDWYKDHFDVKYVAQFTKDGDFINAWNIAEETKNDGFNPDCVRNVLRGANTTHQGFVFKEISWRELEKLDLKGRLNYGKYE